jgi:hypothetical protein
MLVLILLNRLLKSGSPIWISQQSGNNPLLTRLLKAYMKLQLQNKVSKAMLPNFLTFQGEISVDINYLHPARYIANTN